MCRFNPKNDSRFIDPCMMKFIKNLKSALKKDVKVVACCCGHCKYPMTIVIDAGYGIYDLVSGKEIPRKKRFYKKDKQGVYFIPEVENAV